MPSLYRIEVTVSSTEDLFILRTQSVIFNAFIYVLNYFENKWRNILLWVSRVLLLLFIQDMPWVGSIIVFMRFSIHGDDELFVIHTH